MNELDYGELKIKYDTVCMENDKLLAALKVYADKSHWSPVSNGWIFTVWGSPWETAEKALGKESEK